MNVTFLFGGQGQFIGLQAYHGWEAPCASRVTWNLIRLRRDIGKKAFYRNHFRASEFANTSPLTVYIYKKHAFFKTILSLPSEQDTVCQFYIPPDPLLADFSTFLMTLPFLRSGYYGRIQDFGQTEDVSIL